MLLVRLSGTRSVASLCRYVLSVAVGLTTLAPAAAQGTFPFGIASGDVTESAVVLWTRATAAGAYRCEVATDAGFAALAFATDALEAADGGGVKTEVSGLTPSTDYFYRFTRVDGATSAPDRSAVGRFRTAPAPDDAVPLRFLFSGDSNFAKAPFTVLSSAAAEDAAFFLWYGDVIYADAPAGELGVAKTLADYRAKYDQLHSDPHGQALRAAMPILVGWDDHEVQNDYAGRDPGLSAAQRDAAYQAFFEHLPIRDQADASDPFRTYRRVRWGANVELFLLDCRQYRDVSARAECDSHPDPTGYIAGNLFNIRDADCAARLSAPRTMLGPAQLAWLLDGLRSSTAPVKFVVTSIPLEFLGIFPYDRWDGYDAERRTLLETIANEGIAGVFFLAADFHGNFYNPDVLSYFRRYRPDYSLAAGAYVPELIAGPIAMETFGETIEELRHAVLQRAAIPNIAPLLNTLETHVLSQLRRVSGVTFLERNRFSYAKVEVSGDAQVSFEIKGIVPGAAASDGNAVVAESVFATKVQPPVLALAPCCATPLSLLLTAAGIWLVRHRHRRARFVR